MRVAEYIARRLARETDTVFILAGGGAMFLNDAFSWCEGLTPVFCHHEQTCAMAAEAYSRFGGKLGLVNVTTGPGGINAINGVFGAWTDSVPMIVISGQVKRATTLRATGQLGKLRQLGDQEADIISMVGSITKKATFVSEAREVPFVIEEAIQLARDGRPGPVWIDIPIDIQSADLGENRYFFGSRKITTPNFTGLNDAATCVLELVQRSRRPLFLIGSGVRASGALEVLKSVSRALRIPISTAWTAVDAMDYGDELFAERPGAVGTRAGNFIAQKADLLIIIGTRLPIRQVSYNFENFGKNAVKVCVDIEYEELTKPLTEIDFLIHADAKHFLDTMDNISRTMADMPSTEKWIANIKKIRHEFPPIEESIRERGHGESLNPYLFIEDLWSRLNRDDVVACADASASVIPLQVAQIQLGQRLFTNAGAASMGYDLPAAIGAALANPDKRIVCLAGDGSIMLNIQDLETIKRYALNIKIILLNNSGYLSIKLSQQGFFKREKGSGPNSGLNFPDFKKVAESNEISYCRIQRIEDYEIMDRALKVVGPTLIEAIIDPMQSFEPKLGSFVRADGKIESNSLENMSPLIGELRLSQIMKDHDDN